MRCSASMAKSTACATMWAERGALSALVFLVGCGAAGAPGEAEPHRSQPRTQGGDAPASVAPPAGSVSQGAPPKRRRLRLRLRRTPRRRTRKTLPPRYHPAALHDEAPSPPMPSSSRATAPTSTATTPGLGSITSGRALLHPRTQPHVSECFGQRSLIRASPSVTRRRRTTRASLAGCAKRTRSR